MRTRILVAVATRPKPTPEETVPASQKSVRCLSEGYGRSGQKAPTRSMPMLDVRSVTEKAAVKARHAFQYQLTVLIGPPTREGS